MKKLMASVILSIISLYSQQCLPKEGKLVFYEYKQIIDIEIALCDQLPKNRIYRCLMQIIKET